MNILKVETIDKQGLNKTTGDQAETNEGRGILNLSLNCEMRWFCL